MRILVFSTLFPNAAAPNHGVFVENRLRAYCERYDADIRVVAPVPWFPFKHKLFGQYARFARTPLNETRHGLPVSHPRYVLAPGRGMQMAPSGLARVLKKSLEDLAKQGWRPDLIDAHYLYPDGVAAARIAHEAAIPFVMTARGTDVSLIPEYPEPREAIMQSVMRADAVITVASALKTRLVELGAPAQKIKTLRNGVDLKTFRPLDRARIRAELGLEGPIIASVGHLVGRKGHDLAIDALKDVPGAQLMIVGEGEEEKALKAQVKASDLSERVKFIGAVPHKDMAAIYNAADILLLASSREGWPNVLLEAMACGTPCIAADVWGNREVIAARQAGLLTKERSAKAFAGAARTLLSQPIDREAVRAYASAHSWDATTDGMHAVVSTLARKTRRRAALSTPALSKPRRAKPQLIVTVDTEELFDWNDFSPDAHRLAPVSDIKPFQKICEDADARPLYFLSYPLLATPKIAKYYRALLDSGRADCGVHLHSWVTPPNNKTTGAYFSFQKNLPEKIHRAKLQTLCQTYQTAFNAHAVAHRAGRYGIAPENYPLLAEVGIFYDFSPSAAFDFSEQGGPDFTGLSNHPFRVDGDHGAITVLPVSGADALRHTDFFLSRKNCTPGFAKPRRQPFAVPVRLSPEGASLEMLINLSRRLVSDGAPILTYTLHSSSLTEGANTYGRDAQSVERLLTTTRDYLTWFKTRLGGEIISLGDLVTRVNVPHQDAA